MRKGMRKAFFLKTEAELQKIKDQIDQKTYRRTERESISAAVLDLEWKQGKPASPICSHLLQTRLKTKENRHKCSLFRSRMIRRKSIRHSP